MGYDKNGTTALARIPIEKHGDNAAPQAVEHMWEWVKISDIEMAVFWAEVAEIVRSETSLDQPRLYSIGAIVVALVVIGFLGFQFY